MVTITMCRIRVTMYISPYNTMYHITHQRIAMYYQEKYMHDTRSILAVTWC